ncbi:MAG: DUF4185 domain-containing protein [Corynebacterium sp.]|nr:DUF4185 domain-containing protein [Corynebacterium sp.]
MLHALYRQTVTGPRLTGRFGFNATDLGYSTPVWKDPAARRDPREADHILTVFGDTFRDYVGGPGYIGSPFGLRQLNGQDFIWDSAIGGYTARKMLPYQSKGTPSAGELPDGFTHIPCDILQLPDGTFIMTTFAVRSWDPITPGQSWATFHSRLWRSEDEENWRRTEFIFPNDGRWSHFQNNSLVLLGDTIYVFGTNEGRWVNGGIHLMRVHWQELENPEAYEFWAYRNNEWQWTSDQTDPILLPSPGQGIGEINANLVEGRVFLAFVDGAHGVTIAEAEHPAAPWTLHQGVISHQDLPCQYAPAIHPFSTAECLQILISRWDPPGVLGPDVAYETQLWEIRKAAPQVN